MRINRFSLSCFFILVFGLLLRVLIFSQENSIRFEHLSSEQGLSQNVVYCILQDKKGFMWFGTQNGLNRFDGYQYKIYKYNPKKEGLTLTVNTVTVIYEDRTGKLWIGTDGGGLSYFEREGESFIRCPYESDVDTNPGPDINLITAICEDRRGIIWVGTLGGGILCFNPQNRKWSRFVHKSGISGTLSENKIRCFWEDRRGLMWIGTEGGGVNIFDPKTEEFFHYSHDAKNQDSLINNIVYSIYEDSQGNLWMGTQGGLELFDFNNKKFIHHQFQPKNPKSLSNNIVRVIFEDSKKRLWVGTEEGLNLLSRFPEGKVEFIRYLNELNNPYSLSYNNIYSITEDDSGSIWIGTFGGGVNRIDPQKQRFVHFYGNPYASNSLSSNDISCLYEDKKGILWVGTSDSGLNRYNPNTGNFTHYKDNNTLSSNDIMALYEDRKGILWIGTWGGGISLFDREKEAFSHFTSDENSDSGIQSNDIFCFCEDQEGNLWIGTWKGGLNLYHPEKKEFSYYMNDPQNPKSISSNGVTFIFPDIRNKKILWVGMYSSGLERFNRQTDTFVHYSHKPEKLNSLSHNSVLSVYISKRYPEIIWIGTYGGGLNKFDSEEDHWHIYSEEDGLCNNTIYGILEDNDGNLWLSTIKGLSRFNPENETFKNYYAEDGLQHNEFNQGAFYKSRDGHFYFGGINGFNSFLPEEMTENSKPPQIVITDFKVYNREFHLKKSILETRKVVLSHRDVFSFEFAALNYIASAKNRYAYMMVGYDDDWIDLDYKRDITFSGLSHGKYIFKVIGSNNDNVWNRDGASIEVVITPPFYKTWWFQILLAMTVIAFILILYKMRVRRYKLQRKKLEIEVVKRTEEISKQKEIIEVKNRQLENSNQELQKSERELRELNATKDKFFSIISHDLKNHLTALLGFSDMLFRSFAMLDDEKKHKYSRSIDRSAKDLYDLLENLLQWSRSQTGGLQCKPKIIDLGFLIPEIISIYIINAKKKKVHITHEIENDTLAYADKNMVRTILRNLISNAIKFTGGGGKIQVTAAGRDGYIKVSVADSGIGISNNNINSLFKIDKAKSTRGTAKEKGTGLGLILCKEFVEKNNGKIWFESPAPNGEGKGSVFHFTLPRPVSGD